ncbi:MAG: D-aminoacylase [Acidobacteriota bacterium]|nr:MAG: D-aminoacylase [Acidobacteriota bacterium]
MKLKRRLFLKATVGAGAAYARKLLQRQSFDLILRGGSVIDGSGAPARTADVGVAGARISAIGDLSGVTAARTLDVSGLTVTPGFIDVHTHSEDELITNPKAESKIRQGVTTELLGMDGGSFAPTSFADELEKLESSGIAVNAGSFVGQGTLRGQVMAMSDRAATVAEIAEMQELAASALRQGALGISSGLEYTPGGFATGDEIGELCKVMGGTRGLYATHMRNEDDRVLEAVEEAIAIAERGGVGLHISHLKCQGQRNWSKVDDIFHMIERAESRGVSVTFDRYPYLAYATGLSNLMPLWSREGGSAKFIERLQDPDVWPRIREAMADKIDLLGSWDAVMISSVRLPKNVSLQGRTIAEIVHETGEDPFDYTRSLVIEEDNHVDIVGFGMGEETTARILAHPKCMPASDASALATYGALSRGNPHPRAYGTFARVLSKYVREMNVMTLEESIRKMTSLPAERFAIADRGRLAEGYFADIAVFDQSTVEDKATFAKPHQYARGFEAVLVNGQLVLEGDERSEELPGKVLRGDVTPAV